MDHLSGWSFYCSTVLCSIAVCTFSSRSDTEWYVVVGTARELILSPRSCAGGTLVLFRISPDGTKLDHVHTVIRVKVLVHIITWSVKTADSIR